MIKTEIISPEGMIFSDSVDMVVVPTINGEIGVLQKHTPILTKLKKGLVRIKKSGETKKFNIDDGFLEALPDKVVIITNSATKV